LIDSEFVTEVTAMEVGPVGRALVLELMDRLLHPEPMRL
jgi:hypothetical protein